MGSHDYKRKPILHQVEPTWLSEEGIKAYTNVISYIKAGKFKSTKLKTIKKEAQVVSWETDYAAKMVVQEIRSIYFPENELKRAIKNFQEIHSNSVVRFDEIFELEASLTVHEATDHEDASKQSAMKAVVDMKRYNRAETMAVEALRAAKGRPNVTDESRAMLKDCIVNLERVCSLAEVKIRLLRNMSNLMGNIALCEPSTPCGFYNTSDSITKIVSANLRATLHSIQNAYDEQLRLLRNACDALKCQVSYAQLPNESLLTFSHCHNNFYEVFKKNIFSEWIAFGKLLRSHSPMGSILPGSPWDYFPCWYRFVEELTIKTAVLKNSVIDKTHEFNSIVEDIKLKLLQKQFSSPDFREPCCAELDLALRELQNDICKIVSQFHSEISKMEGLEIRSFKTEAVNEGLFHLVQMSEDFSREAVLVPSILQVHRFKQYLIVLQGVYLHYLMPVEKKVSMRKNPPTIEGTLDYAYYQLMQNAYQTFPNEFGYVPQFQSKV